MIKANKQRIVGAAVFFILAVTLLPIIFDGQGSYQSSMESRIPDEPTINILSEPRQSRPLIIADTAIAANEEVGIEHQIVDVPLTDDLVSSAPEELLEGSEEAIENLSLDQLGLPRGWSVRLGSFAELTNATNLVDRLRESGYKAYTNSFSNNAGDLTSVLVGPWIDRSLADEYQKELEDEFMLPGDIVLYEIDQ